MRLPSRKSRSISRANGKRSDPEPGKPLRRLETYPVNDGPDRCRSNRTVCCNTKRNSKAMTRRTSSGSAPRFRHCATWSVRLSVQRVAIARCRSYEDPYTAARRRCSHSLGGLRRLVCQQNGHDQINLTGNRESPPAWPAAGPNPLRASNVVSRLRG